MAISTSASAKYLFIGDSITDCDRTKDPEQIGFGYVRMVRDYLLAKNPASAPGVINRGINGNKIPDLQKRWQRDVIDLKPDVLSVFIGINDVWHGLAGRDGCDVGAYQAGYEEILGRVREAFPKIVIVLCEPSVLWLDKDGAANAKLKPYIHVAHQLAGRFGAGGIVRLHEAFVNARAARPEVAWTTDGVHPTSIGHTLIAREWLMATGLL